GTGAERRLLLALSRHDDGYHAAVCQCASRPTSRGQRGRRPPASLPDTGRSVSGCSEVQSVICRIIGRPYLSTHAKYLSLRFLPFDKAHNAAVRTARNVDG